MKRLIVGVLVGSLIGVSGVTASDSDKLGQDTPRQAARALALDYLVPLAASDTRRVHLAVARCRDLGRWNGCQVVVRGQTTCRAVVRVLDPKGSEYTGWIPKMRCR